MTKKIIASLFTVAVVLTCTPRPSFADEKKTPLEEQMDTMNKAFKTLKKQVADASKKDANAELVATMKKSAIASKDLAPEKAKDVPEADRAKFVEEYKGALDKLIAGIDSLDKAVRDGNADATKAAIEDLTKQKGDGHKKFQKDEDK